VLGTFASDTSLRFGVIFAAVIIHKFLLAVVSPVWTITGKLPIYCLYPTASLTISFPAQAVGCL